MAQITGQAGVNLSSDLAAYLSAQNGDVTSEQLSEIINQYLTGGDKIVKVGIFLLESIKDSVSLILYKER